MLKENIIKKSLLSIQYTFIIKSQINKVTYVIFDMNKSLFSELRSCYWLLKYFIVMLCMLFIHYFY